MGTTMTDVHELVAKIRSSDKDEQGRAFEALIAMTDTGVDWTYDVWDEIVADLSHATNRVRAIVAQLLCNLAKSDPKQRIRDARPQLMVVTTDERFVTARRCLPAAWCTAGSPWRGCGSCRGPMPARSPGHPAGSATSLRTAASTTRVRSR
jgi:hypothetical protein